MIQTSRKKKRKSGISRITGTIQPSRRNGEENPARIVIRTDEHREYQIDFSGAGKELRSLLNATVAVQGKIREQLNGQELLTVRKYEVIHTTDK